MSSDSALSSPTPAYLQNLNPQQRAAVEHVDGPLLVLAGAGTGKTRVLTTRLVHILATRRAWPSQILAVTFTNKAAAQMKERIGAMLGRDVAGEGPGGGWWLGTFHALAARMLRRHAEHAGLKPTFTILDADDQVRLVKQLLQAARIDDKKWPARVVSSVIERWKDRGLTPDRVPSGDGGEVANGKAIEIYRQYQDRLKTLNACDFGDLLLHNLTIFQTRPDVLAEYHEKFKYILVDEYQDTNVAQYLWLRLLAQRRKNICCVGDDDQCLAEGTRVTMADGTRRPIENIKAGDAVLSCYGSGDFRAARVVRRARRRATRAMIRIGTRGGRTLVSTPEHTHFAGYRLGAGGQRHFTYVMRRRGIGYRIGVTRIYTDARKDLTLGFELRCRQEHGDALWVVGVHESSNAARAEEYVLSLQYGIPTVPFVPRKQTKGGVAHDAEWIARVFAAVDTEAGAHRLMAARGLDPAAPHFVPRSRDSNRHNVVVTLCADRRGRTPMHRVSIVGNDPQARTRLAALGLRVRAVRDRTRSWRVETLCRDYGAAMALAERVRTALPEATLRQVAKLLDRAMPFVRAAAVRPGMLVATADGLTDEVVSVETVPGRGAVYDLDIEATHNFVAEGLVTHNSIYGWRGAEVGNILRFEKDFPGALVIRLEENYRSTRHILAAAAGLIAHNRGRLGKTLWTSTEGGDKVQVRALWDGEAEARWVGEEIEALQRQQHPLGQMAVLVRAGFQTREFEERFLTLGLPYRVIGGPRFYEREEIRDAIAYLRVTAQPDDDLAFERIVNKPRRGLGEATLQTLHRLARAQDISLVAAGRKLVETDEIKPQARASLRRLLDDFARWSAAALGGGDAADLAGTILDESGYTAMWQAERTPDAPGRLENLKELIAAIEEFGTLPGFLEHVSLVMENAEAAPGDMVNLMTLHSAKGLEFDTVFLPGWEEGLLPHPRAVEEKGEAGLEEERRLAHVGLTRARRRAYVSFAANRRIHNLWQSSVPSRFVSELPKDDIEMRSEAGLWGSGGAGEEASGFAAGPRGRERFLDASVAATPFHSTLRRGPAAPYAEGARVFHQKFGYGRVVAAEAGKLDIEFDKAGRKKVMDSFVEPA